MPYAISNIDDNYCDCYKESWEKFGRNLEEYISFNKIDLESESYDIILSFSRGGSILAFAFSCLLKDKCPKAYSDPLKASVRPIPRGLLIKKNDPCFVMNQAATDQEIEDIINNLREDIKRFCDEHNNGNPINILIMDDNLTGATRVKFLEDVLDDMNDLVHSHKTLAYVRHRAFLESEIPTIIKFPESKAIEIFSMPWHKPSEQRRDLKFDNEIRDLVKIKFCMVTDDTLDEFKKKIKMIKYYRIKERGINNILVNGASEFIVEDHTINRVIKLNYISHKFYPSKKCLLVEELLKKEITNEKDNKYLKLCSLNKGERTKGSCLACSILNCNKEMLDNALDSSKSESISIELGFDNENSNLMHAITDWLHQKFPGKVQ